MLPEGVRGPDEDHNIGLRLNHGLIACDNVPHYVVGTTRNSLTVSSLRPHPEIKQVPYTYKGLSLDNLGSRLGCFIFNNKPYCLERLARRNYTRTLRSRFLLLHRIRGDGNGYPTAFAPSNMRASMGNIREETANLNAQVFQEYERNLHTETGLWPLLGYSTFADTFAGRFTPVHEAMCRRGPEVVSRFLFTYPTEHGIRLGFKSSIIGDFLDNGNVRYKDEYQYLADAVERLTEIQPN